MTAAGIDRAINKAIAQLALENKELTFRLGLVVAKLAIARDCRPAVIMKEIDELAANHPISQDSDASSDQIFYDALSLVRTNHFLKKQVKE
jgi:hypothetical protein